MNVPRARSVPSRKRAEVQPALFATPGRSRARPARLPVLSATKACSVLQRGRQSAIRVRLGSSPREKAPPRVSSAPLGPSRTRHRRPCVHCAYLVRYHRTRKPLLVKNAPLVSSTTTTEAPRAPRVRPGRSRRRGAMRARNARSAPSLSSRSKTSASSVPAGHTRTSPGKARALFVPRARRVTWKARLTKTLAFRVPPATPRTTSWAPASVWSAKPGLTRGRTTETRTACSPVPGTSRAFQAPQARLNAHQARTRQVRGTRSASRAR